jgi:hypothetical protein
MTSIARFTLVRLSTIRLCASGETRALILRHSGFYVRAVIPVAYLPDKRRYRTGGFSARMTCPIMRLTRTLVTRVAYLSFSTRGIKGAVCSSWMGDGVFD